MAKPRTCQTSFGEVVLYGDLYRETVEAPDQPWQSFLTPRNVEQILQTTTELLIHQTLELELGDTQPASPDTATRLNSYKALYDAVAGHSLSEVRSEVLAEVIQVVLKGAMPAQKEVLQAHQSHPNDGRFAEMLAALQNS